MILAIVLIVFFGGCFGAVVWLCTRSRIPYMDEEGNYTHEDDQ